MIVQSKKNKIILVVEDERPLVRVIEDKLTKCGFDVVTARTVDQGLGYLEDIKDIDAVWLDHYLIGEKTGINFVEEVKKPESKWKKVPIFVVSNTASNTNVEAYKNLGVDSYSVKSDHRLDQITDDLKKLLEHKK
jgi:DNA-binding response OmpR family regulator